MKAFAELKGMKVETAIFSTSLYKHCKNEVEHLSIKVKKEQKEIFFTLGVRDTNGAEFMWTPFFRGASFLMENFITCIKKVDSRLMALKERQLNES